MSRDDQPVSSKMHDNLCPNVPTEDEDAGGKRRRVEDPAHGPDREGGGSRAEEGPESGVEAGGEASPPEEGGARAEAGPESGVEAGEETSPPCRAQTAVEPSDRERETHYLSGHACYRSWCDACVRARGRRLAHRSADSQSTTPISSWDYCYLGHYDTGDRGDELDDEAEKRGDSPVLVTTDSQSKCIFGALHPRKGCNFDGCEEAVQFSVDTLRRIGYKRIVARSDNEPALVAFINRIRAAWDGDMLTENSHVEDPQSNGAAEAAVGVLKGLVRTLAIHVETKLQRKIPDGHPIYGWIVNMASSVYRRFHMGPDGLTPMERLIGRKSGLQVAEFAERVWYAPIDSRAEARFTVGYYLGLADGRKGSCIATESGIVQARSIKRMPPSEMWNEAVLDLVKSIPLLPPARARFPPQIRVHVPSGEVADGAHHDPPRPKARQVMLLRKDFEAFGWTEHCDRCNRMRNLRPLRGMHTDACRQRMESILRNVDSGRARIQRAADKFARDLEQAQAEQQASAES